MKSWKQTTEEREEGNECKHATHLDCVAVVLVARLDDLAALLCELWLGSELEETTSKRACVGEVFELERVVLRALEREHEVHWVQVEVREVPAVGRSRVYENNKVSVKK
jgi:hypothetical protein